MVLPICLIAPLSAGMFGIQHIHRVHEFLNGNRRVVAQAEIEQVRNNIRRAALQAIDVNTGIKHEFLPCLGSVNEEGQLVIVAARQAFLESEPCPANRYFEIEVRQVRIQASASDQRFLSSF